MLHQTQSPSINAINVDTNVAFATQSTGSGNFTIPALPVGAYRVVAIRDGFKSFTRSGVVISAGGEVRVDIVLELGAVAESVLVTSTAEQLQTNNARITTQVDKRMVDELPLVVSGAMRNAIDLATAVYDDRPFYFATEKPVGIPHFVVRLFELPVIAVLCGGFSEDALRDGGAIAIYRDPADLLEHYYQSPLTG